MPAREAGIVSYRGDTGNAALQHFTRLQAYPLVVIMGPCLRNWVVIESQENSASSRTVAERTVYND